MVAQATTAGLFLDQRRGNRHSVTAFWIDEAFQEKDNKKAAELAPKLADSEKNLGPPIALMPISGCVGIDRSGNYGRCVYRGWWHQRSCVNRSRHHVDLRCRINRGCVDRRCRVHRRCRVPPVGGAASPSTGATKSAADALATEKTNAAAPRTRALLITNLPRGYGVSPPVH